MKRCSIVRHRCGGSVLRPTLLIIGAAGGVGSMAIQLAKLAGLTVLATASRQESTDWVKQLGANHVLESPATVAPAARDRWLLKIVDYILNCADTDGYWDVMTDLIAAQGKICTIVEKKGR